VLFILSVTLRTHCGLLSQINVCNVPELHWIMMPRHSLIVLILTDPGAWVWVAQVCLLIVTLATDETHLRTETIDSGHVSDGPIATDAILNGIYWLYSPIASLLTNTFRRSHAKPYPCRRRRLLAGYWCSRCDKACEGSSGCQEPWCWGIFQQAICTQGEGWQDTQCTRLRAVQVSHFIHYHFI